MKLLHLQNRINELMSVFVAQVKGATAMSHTDINQISETLLIPLFAEIFGLQKLRNLNATEGMNYPGIDLADDEARVAIQVTATSASEKVKHTLQKFVGYEFYKKYDRLIIYILSEKQKSYSGRGFDEITQGKFTFDKNKDILDYRDILTAVSTFQVDKVHRIVSILEDNFGSRHGGLSSEIYRQQKKIINSENDQYGRLRTARVEMPIRVDTWAKAPVSLDEFSPSLLSEVRRVTDETLSIFTSIKNLPENPYENIEFLSNLNRTISTLTFDRNLDIEITCLDQDRKYIVHPWFPDIVGSTFEGQWETQGHDFVEWVWGKIIEGQQGYLTWTDALASDPELEFYSDMNNGAYKRRTIVSFIQIPLHGNYYWTIAVEGHETVRIKLRLWQGRY